MFRRLSEPLPLSEASLLVFRPALNAPVLNVGYLPIGPARAAVVAFGEEYGGIGIALGVRASESGQLVVLRNQESIDFDVPLAQALEPLLAEAERMGFLFDEDMLEETPGQAGRARAMAHWADLMGGMESLLPPRSPDADRSRSEEDDGPVGPLSPSQAVEEMQYPELMLDDVAPLELADEPGASIGLDATETLEPDLDADADADADSGPDPALGGDLEEPLEHGLDEVLADALDDSLDGRLGDDLDDDLDGGDDWALDDAILGESDLTEPTAPIAAAHAKAAPAPQPSPVPVASPPTARSVRQPAAAPPPAARRTVATRVPAPPPVDPMATVVPPAASALKPAAEPAPVMTPAPAAAPASKAPPAPVATPASAITPASAPTPAITPAPAVAAASPAPQVKPQPQPRAEPSPARPPRAVLSKFRNPDGLRGSARAGGSSEVGTDRSSELARIPIVRVRRERDPAKRVPLLARLLSSF